MADEKKEPFVAKEPKPFWSREAYSDAEEDHNNHFTRLRSTIINFLIALAFILGFIGFIVFPQILIPGTLLLSACLIGAQALCSFAILAAIAKALYRVYKRGATDTLRMIVFAPINFFYRHPFTSVLFTLGFLSIGILIILSGTGVISVPFLTVFAANSLSLEIEEIIFGLLSDIAVVSVGVMLFYLPSLIQEWWERAAAEPVILPLDEADSKERAEVIEVEEKQVVENDEDSNKKESKETVVPVPVQTAEEKPIVENDEGRNKKEIDRFYPQ